MKNVLLLATTTGYQTRMFGEAADRLGVRLLFATDRCDQLDDPWSDQAIAVRYYQEATAVQAVATVADDRGLDGILAVGDLPTVAAAYASQLLGLPGHPPEAAKAARDKRLARERFEEAGLLVPHVVAARRTNDPRVLAGQVDYPAVIKPTVLSGSRGVIRVNDPAEFVLAFARVCRLLESPDVRQLRDPGADDVLVESFIPGREFAVEGVLQRGHLHTLAIFDKPDPLDGPFFEETIYVTPSRADESTQGSIRSAIARAARALGLWHGPVHAECRVNEFGVYVLEVAARPIGGLCARTLRFDGPNQASASLEELLLRHAIGETIDGWTREAEASGVMMVPIPSAGVYRRVRGVEEALAVPGAYEVTITAKPDQQLVPLPEGSSYLGFIFARAADPAQVERALRAAHSRLAFEIDRQLPLVAKGS